MFTCKTLFLVNSVFERIHITYDINKTCGFFFEILNILCLYCSSVNAVKYSQLST